MDRKTILGAIFGFLGVIFIGAISSGVWEYILEPTLFWTRDSVLNVASLGIEAFKDDTYREIAQGYTEATSGQVYYLLVLVFIMAVTWQVSSALYKTRELRDNWQKLLNKIAEGKETFAKEPPSTEDLERDAPALEPEIKRVQRMNYINAALLALLLAANLITYARNRYVIAAISHYHQALRIAAPYLTSTEEKEIGSAFAQVSKKADNIAVVSKLEGVASATTKESRNSDPGRS